MPKLNELNTENTYHRILYCGASGAGKTGSLTSLAKAGYQLRIIDLDNGYSVLKQFIQHECPEALENVSVVSFRDKYKSRTGVGVVVDGAPEAFIKTLNALDKWPDDESNPAEWGADHICVLDSLTALGRASYSWFDALNPTVKEKRQIYNMAQQAVMQLLQNLTAESFHTHTIVCTHVQFNETETRGFPTSIGRALGPQIPSLFNNYILAETRGHGKSLRRVIHTNTTGVFDLKNERPFDVTSELPLETGLADFFKQVSA